MKIDTKELTARPEFLQVIAETICDRKNQDLTGEWSNAFMDEFRKQLRIEINQTVKDWIENDKENIKGEIERTLRQMSKTEIIELLKGGSLF